VTVKLAAFLVVLCTGPLHAQGQSQALPGWLSGCWELNQPGRVTTEMWMPPGGGVMMGASRTVAGGAVRESERITLRVEGDRLVYVAHPSGQAEASFRATEVTDSGFVVANPAHDFPQRIIYRRRGLDSLIARIEGTVQDRTRGIDFPMKRVSCRADTG
jgi:hypothetical protein